jgi:hypothetical protein
MMRRQWSSVSRRNGAGSAIPALATQIETGPRARAAAAIPSRTEVSSAHIHPQGVQSRPRGRDPFQPLQVAPGDRHLRSAHGQRLGDAQADPRASPGHERMPALELHTLPPAVPEFSKTPGRIRPLHRHPNAPDSRCNARRVGLRTPRLEEIARHTVAYERICRKGGRCGAANLLLWGRSDLLGTEGKCFENWGSEGDRTGRIAGRDDAGQRGSAAEAGL